MQYIKINGTQYPAKILGYSRDLNWGNRESKHITLEMTYAEAAALFVDGLAWSMIIQPGKYLGKNGQVITPDPVETDMGVFDLAGAITDNRDGTVTVRMGKALPAEVVSVLTAGGSVVQLSQAAVLRSAMETAAESLDDKTASEAPQLLRPMRYDGQLIGAGTRIQWGGVVKRAAVDLWDTEENSPDNAADFWEDIQYRRGIRIIPQTITVGLAFALGEQGWWGDVLYVSKADANVYTPAEYPDNWEAV